MRTLIRTTLMKMFIMTVMWNMIMTHHDKENRDWQSQRANQAVIVNVPGGRA